MMEKPDRSIRIRQSLPDDLPFLRSLALDVFSVYGDYETILTDFFVLEGVHTYVAEEIGPGAALPVGILMMVIRQPRRRAPYWAEILAIAVEESHQGNGVGSSLIEFAKEWPRSLWKMVRVPEIHLSVAETNTRGRAFFKRRGFSIIREEPWRYPAGQRALRMRYVLKG